MTPDLLSSRSAIESMVRRRHGSVTDPEGNPMCRRGAGQWFRGQREWDGLIHYDDGRSETPMVVQPWERQ